MTIRFPFLNLQLDNIPAYYEILNFRVSMMGIMIAAAMLLGILIVILEAKRKQKNVNKYLGALIAAVIGGFAGGRAMYAACHYEEYFAEPLKILMVREGGYVFYGALFGGLLFLAIICLLMKQSFEETADIFAAALVLGQAIGRIGDFFCRQSFGEYTDLPTAMQIPLAGVRAADLTPLIRENVLDIGGIPYIQVHPAFLYESAACIILFFVLVWKNRHKKFEGQTLLTYLTWYGFIRFFVEWIRTDKLMIPGTEMDINLVISAGMFLLFGIVLRIRTSMAKKRLQVKRDRQEQLYQEEERAGEQFDREEEERERKIREIQERRMKESEEQASGEGMSEETAVSQGEKDLVTPTFTSEQQPEISETLVEEMEDPKESSSESETCEPETEPEKESLETDVEKNADFSSGNEA